MGICSRITVSVKAGVDLGQTPEEVRYDPAVLEAYLGADEEEQSDLDGARARRERRRRPRPRACRARRRPIPDGLPAKPVPEPAGGRRRC